MGPLLAKIAIGLVTRLITEQFFSVLIVEGFRAWSKQTENKFDDRVSEAVAKSFGVPVEVLTTKK